MKTNSGLFTLLAVLMFCISCQNQTGQDNTMDDTTGIRSAPGARAGGDMRDQRSDFVDDMVENYQREKSWLRAGMEKGTSQEVQQMARDMMTDHQNMISELTNYATANNMSLPDTSSANVSGMIEDAEREIIGITDEGTEWDEEWADEIGDEHQSLVRRLERAQNNIQDNELRRIIDKYLPIMRDHLEKARNLENQLDRQDNR